MGRPRGAQPEGQLAAGQRQRLAAAAGGGAGLRPHRPAPPGSRPGTGGSRRGCPGAEPRSLSGTSCRAGAKFVLVATS